MKAVIRVRYNFKFALIEEPEQASILSPRDNLPSGDGACYSDFPVPDNTPNTKLLDLRSLLPDMESFRKILRENAVKIVLSRQKELNIEGLRCNIAIMSVDPPAFHLFRNEEEVIDLYGGDKEVFSYRLTSGSPKSAKVGSTLASLKEEAIASSSSGSASSSSGSASSSSGSASSSSGSASSQPD